jgi:hypothetical protein
MNCKGMCRDLFQDSVPQFHKATREESGLTKIRVNQISLHSDLAGETRDSLQNLVKGILDGEME